MSHRQSKRPAGRRKLFTFILMLALVVMCIYQLNDPKTLAPILRAFGVTPSDQPAHTAPVPTTHPSGSASDHSQAP